MFSRRRKRKKYKFADDQAAVDTVISLIFGGLSILVTVGCIIYSTIQGGRVSDRVGILMLMSLVMGITGLGFGIHSFRVVEGDNNLKRTSVILSILALVLLLVMYLI